jgi:hypothetical protein
MAAAALLLAIGITYRIPANSTNRFGGGFKRPTLFVGSAELTTDQEWPSQVGQDSIIASIYREFKGRKHFIDLAANDAIKLSNTFALERLGWNGLCIEANPIYFWDLARRRCHLIGAVVSDTIDAVVKFSPVDAFGAVVDPSIKADDKFEALARGKKPLEYRSVTLAHVLDTVKFSSVVHFLSLDIEGSEFRALQHFPFERYSLKLLSVERPSRQLMRLLNSNGFLLVHCIVNWGDTLWAHRSILESDSDGPSRQAVDGAIAQFKASHPDVRCAYNNPGFGIGQAVERWPAPIEAAGGRERH